jgi:ubiquinone/menaquinone biosynthesis C-methylase UbiE
MSKKRNSSDDQNWDAYWSRASNKQTHAAYSVIASFYRKFIIRPSLTKFIKLHFKEGAKVLHAGCGSGQVDESIASYIDITPLDLSEGALVLYKQYNPGAKNLTHASIFEIPVEDNTFDGIYNLGVMEHFSEQDIQKILKEFTRVLKPGGTMILFWPPKFGLSVLFLKGVHYLLNNILGKNVYLHPEELTHINSRRHAQNILRAADIQMVDYAFDISDLLTHAIIVGKKPLASDHASLITTQ